MLTMLNKYKPLLIILAIFIVGFVGVTAFMNSRYRITRVSPNNEKYPSSLGQMDIYFNRKLDKQNLDSRIKEDPGKVVKADFKSAVRIAAFDDHLHLVFSQTPLTGDYELHLLDIRTVDGETLTKNLPLNVRDINYDDLTKEEKAIFDKAAAAGADNEFAEFPLLAKLPHETDKYQITPRFGEGDPAPTIIITMKFFEPGSVAIPATSQEEQAYLQDVRTYRKEALDWLRSQAPDLEQKYSLEYTELELRNEFPAGRGRYQNESGAPETDSGQTQ